MEDRMRSIIEKMGWSLKYYDNCNWHPEVIEFSSGDIDLYGVNNRRTDDCPYQNSADADYFCTVKREYGINVRVDKADEEYIPLLEMVLPQYHFFVHY